MFFSLFLTSFGRPWSLFWHPFGAFVVSFGVLVSSFWVPLARLGCLWALSATFCGAFGSSRLSVGSGIAPGLLFGSFSKFVPCFFDCFSFVSVVGAAPQARPKTTAVANTALRQFPSSPPSLNELPVPLLRQVSRVVVGFTYSQMANQ